MTHRAAVRARLAAIAADDSLPGLEAHRARASEALARLADGAGHDGT